MNTDYPASGAQVQRLVGCDYLNCIHSFSSYFGARLIEAAVNALPMLLAIAEAAKVVTSRPAAEIDAFGNWVVDHEAFHVLTEALAGLEGGKV